MKRLKQIKESIAMSVGGGAVAGMPTASPAEQTPVALTGMLRRKPPSMFGGRAVFRVPSDRYNKALKGRKKFEHYTTYVGRDEIGEEIRAYIRENPNAPVILEDEITGAMVFLKYGKR